MRELREQRARRLAERESGPPDFEAWRQAHKLAGSGTWCPGCGRCHGVGTFNGRRTCAWCRWCETD